MGAQVDELGTSIQVREVLNIQLEVDWLEVLVHSVDLYFVDGTVAHLRQKAGLVLRPSRQSLSCEVAVLESTSWVASEGED